MHTDYHEKILAAQCVLSYDEYAEFYQFAYVEDGSEQQIPIYQTGYFRLTGLRAHKRIYERSAVQGVIEGGSAREEMVEPLTQHAVRGS